ncbi:helix-turn-helix domain-containing protein [Brevibacillus sp. B_LB10_24]|uniref:helix-turn-helix domain-containing protein n=1 Tax=Brevibacillus TaxID=55080 RepID=UPI0002F607BD|nr:helix-turn-helix transcriptional regulator [Brevibacillus massiliensis]
MFGLGKKRTKLGKWLDKRGISQAWLAKESKVSENTISDLTNKDDRIPNGRTMKKVLNALRKVDPTVKQDDFWQM